MDIINIVGLVGSLRKDSFNHALMEQAKESLPKNATLTVADIGNLPLFNQDFEQNPPDVVKKFKEQIKNADAILIASPEYNYSIPGVLKNAIDWASRPYGNNSFDKKPVGIMSAAGGMLGGARMQYQLRQTFIFLNMFPLNTPEVMVALATEKITGGKVTDQHTKEKIKEMVDALLDWTQKLKKGGITA